MQQILKNVGFMLQQCVDQQFMSISSGNVQCCVPILVSGMNIGTYVPHNNMYEKTWELLKALYNYMKLII